MEIEEQLENIDNKIEDNIVKTNEITKLARGIAGSLQQTQIFENECAKNLYTGINNIYNLENNISVDVKKIIELFDEYKNNADLSNNTVNDNMSKIEELLTSYKEHLSEIDTNSSDETIKNTIKEINDNFYIELIKLFDSLSFESEAEDLKDFMANVISQITVKADENSEKLNSIMLQFKNLLNKVESIEKTQSSISDYLKPEENDDLVYSFDDIQTDLAKMRLVLNDISNNVSAPELVEELSAKMHATNEQVNNISKLLYKNAADEEEATNIKDQIDSLNSQIYDISMRTNKLLLTNEDSNIELKNNLELFKEIFDKSNPDKVYDLFYELVSHFNDITEKIGEVTNIVRASHNETVTVKNALTYVGEWMDNATNILSEIKANSEVNDNEDELEEIKEEIENITDRIDFLEKSTNRQLEAINAKLDTLLSEKASAVEKVQSRAAAKSTAKAVEKASRTTSTKAQLKNMDKKFSDMEEILSKLSEKIMKE